ncbi:hypothetical protein CSAL01_00426 [Colletotrichum salicis]|uniref:Uncharacterized protein n=1 Tax=Colletotrichum salicis TaxID=1209931 RepID=A0A135V9V8_9PEZI|nr:hypothetical protein CSAL01_00426 [Colletotrichum salicis]
MELTVQAHHLPGSRAGAACSCSYLTESSYPRHTAREQADLVHWIGFFDQTNSDSGARNRRCVVGVKSGGDKVCSVARSSSGPFLVEQIRWKATRDEQQQHSIVQKTNDVLLGRRQRFPFPFTNIATTDDSTNIRGGMQLRCLMLGIGVSQQWKCQSESQVQVPGRTDERLPIEERFPLPYRSFPAIPSHNFQFPRLRPTLSAPPLQTALPGALGESGLQLTRRFVSFDKLSDLNRPFYRPVGRLSLTPGSTLLLKLPYLYSRNRITPPRAAVHALDRLALQPGAHRITAAFGLRAT